MLLVVTVVRSRRKCCLWTPNALGCNWVTESIHLLPSKLAAQAAEQPIAALCLWFRQWKLISTNAGKQEEWKRKKQTEEGGRNESALEQHKRDDMKGCFKFHRKYVMKEPCNVHGLEIVLKMIMYFYWHSQQPARNHNLNHLLTEPLTEYTHQRRSSDSPLTDRQILIKSFSTTKYMKQPQTKFCSAENQIVFEF